MQICLFTVVLVLIKGGLGSCGTCFNASSVVEIDAHMEHYIFRKVRSPSLYSCASECLMSAVCMSFNFETKTRICELNSNRSDLVAITTWPGFLYSDINHWPKSLAGACSKTPCPTSRCQLDRLGRASCETEFQGCEAPPSVANAEISYDGVYEGAIAEYTCKDNFIMCTDRNQRVCQLTGNWNGSVGPCAQYSWDNPVMNFLMVVPCGNATTFKVAMNITPTVIRFYFVPSGDENMSSKHPRLIQILEVINDLATDQYDLVFCWLPSHVGIIGNPMADDAAKAALNKSVTPLLIPYNDYKPLPRSYIRIPNAKEVGHPIYMDVRGDGNLLYHAAFRLDENTLVLNSRFSGVWGTATVLSPVPLAVGTEALVEIRLDQGMYTLAVDGSSINNFTDRYPNEIREDVRISGDANVTSAYITI